MNIFATDDCPVKSARNLDDRRIVKMILESAQMLSTAINVCGGRGFYRSTHAKHPCSVWTRETQGNYKWLMEHFSALLKEKGRRFSSPAHSCAKHLPKIEAGVNLIPPGDLQPFVDCSGIKGNGDVKSKYRKCLNVKWEKDRENSGGMYPRFYGKMAHVSI